MRALLIDDEPLARGELRRLLAKHPQIEIVAEAADADQAREAIQRTSPDLLFLDVQMPEENGFELLASLNEGVPAVIFTTAFDQHALRAFEFGALDYLVKPVEPDRLADAIDRAERFLSGHTPPTGAEDNDVDIPEAVEEISENPLSPGEKVFVRDGDRCWFVPVESIRCIEAEGNHARLTIEGAEPLVHRTLAELEQRLPMEMFFRASRSQILNLRSVESVEPWFSGSLRAKLTGGKVIELSRRQSRIFRQRLGL